MNRKELRGQVRVWLDDGTEQPQTSDEQINDLLNEAQREAALRTRVLVDSRTAGLTRINVPANTAELRLSPSVIFVKRAVFYDAAGTESWRLIRTTFDTLDQHQEMAHFCRSNANWEQVTAQRPFAIVQDLQRRVIRLAPTPTQAGTLRLTVVRYPLECEELSADDSKPVLDEHFHRPLGHWVVRQIQIGVDAETYNADVLAKHDNLFTEAFGPAQSMKDIRAAATDRSGETASYFF